MEKTVLLTGGTGFIGSHCAVALLSSGYRVVLVDNFSNSHPDTLEKIKSIAFSDEGMEINEEMLTFINVDLTKERDLAPLRAVFVLYDIEAVIHLAAFKSVPISITKPVEYYHNNLSSLLNVMNVMQENHVYKLLFSSSATV